jgi:quinol-cytochrome oxidoreductase complex cytochrome b subunit
MYCGAMPAEQPYVIISQFGTAYWFGFLFILAPLVGLYESPKNLPSSIHKSLK